MISLSDRQLLEVRNVAALVPWDLRGAFLLAFADRLVGRDYGDADVYKAAIAARATVVPPGRALFR